MGNKRNDSISVKGKRQDAVAGGNVRSSQVRLPATQPVSEEEKPTMLVEQIAVATVSVLALTDTYSSVVGRGASMFSGARSSSSSSLVSSFRSSTSS